MQELPAIEVISFLEWLNHSSLKNQNEDIDETDLLFNEEYYPWLRELAEKFCFEQRKKVDDIQYSPDQEFVKLFLAFRDSRYYSECIRRNKQIQCENNYDHSINSFFSYFKSFCFDSDYRRKFGNSNIISDLNVQDLISSTQTYIKNSQQDDSNIIHFLAIANPVEMDFLEWIGREYDHKSAYLKIDTMSVEQFEELANKYCFKNQKGTDDAKKLVRFFKKTDPRRIINRLKSLSKYNNNKDLKYLINRYCNDETRFKCMILTLESKESYKPYKKMIKDYYDSLDEMSGEILDIYYSGNHYEKSGYKTTNSLTYINNDYIGRLPCIMLWKDKMEKARYISIDKLNDNDIFQVISFIVKAIKHGMELNNIVMEAEKMSKERNANVFKNTINNYGNMGSAVIGDNANIQVGFTADENNSFLNELNTARKIISENEELNDSQRNELLDIIKEAKESVEENSDDKAKRSKARFKSILAFMEDHGSKLITSFAGLATLAKFFGF